VTTNQYQWRTAFTDPQEIFDIIHPVGEVYVQYPQQDPPATIYNKSGITSTWTVIDYNGAFFRAQGGNAIAFSEKGSVLSTQSDMVKSHTHGMKNHTHSGTTGSCRNLADGQERWTGGWDARGIESASQNSATGGAYFAYGSAGYGGGHGAQTNATLCFNVDHRHDFSTGSPSDNTTDSNNSNNTENRPMNYTIRVWKRTA
jgi:hypothetical protein